MKKSSKYALGTAIATGIGYVAGVLTAPKSGKETRKDIQNQALKAKQESEKKLKELNEELSKLINVTKTKAKNLEEGAKSEFDKALSVGVTAKDRAREILSAFHEGETEDKDLQKAVNDVHKAIDHLKDYLDKYGDDKSKD